MVFTLLSDSYHVKTYAQRSHAGPNPLHPRELHRRQLHSFDRRSTDTVRAPLAAESRTPDGVNFPAVRPELLDNDPAVSAVEKSYNPIIIILFL